MILISHRGNLNGRNISMENKPTYIDEAISLGYDVECDVWYVENLIFLGHDKPEYEINLEWILERIKNLWIHCKNTDCIVFMKSQSHNINFFWHENDTLTITSLGYIWVYPGKQPIVNSICVMPELGKENTNFCLGICSDTIENYNNKL